MSVSQRVLVSLMLFFSIALSNSAFAAGKLNKIFITEMIGANLPYLEKITGPAKNTVSYKQNEKTNTYKVDGCEINVRVSNEKIQSLGIENLTQKCTFNLNAFLSNNSVGKLPPLYNMTFGQFDAFTGEGKYTSDCLMGCGNAADPVAYDNWQGSRAYGFLEIQLGAVLGSNAAGDASSKWQSAMVRDEGEEWVIATKFNCSDKYNSIAQKAFKNVKITSATIGFGLTDRDCNP